MIKREKTDHDGRIAKDGKAMSLLHLIRIVLNPSAFIQAVEDEPHLRRYWYLICKI
jgi:hypothetical protein